MSSTPIDPLRPVSALILPSRNTAIRSALGYAAAGATWMFSSGWVLHRLVLDHVWEVRGGVLSGWLFVAVTALLLGFALDRYFRVIRRSARRLQESETRWKQALEGASQAVWDWNLQTSEVFYSTEWKAMLGYQPHELANVLPEWETRVHPDDLPRVREELNRHLAGETPDYASEHRLRCKDGSFKWILDRGKVTSRSSDGKPLRLVGTHSDIHRRKQAEERSRIQHNLMLALAGTNYLDEGLRFCLDAAINADGLTCGGLYLADPKTGTLNLCVHSGLSVEFTKSVARFDPESPQGRVVAAGKPVYAQFEQLRLKQSGAELREGLHSIAILPILRQGEVLGCLNVASRTHDEIPEYARIALETIAASAGEAIARLRVREELRESELNFRTFFDTVDDVIVVATPDGRILFGNAAVERKLGFSAQELAGMAVPDLHPPERRAEAGEILAAMFRGERQVCPLPLARRDGWLLPVETRVWYGKWNGQPCLFGVCKDLSAEQEAQQRFERLFRLNPLPMALLSVPDRCFQDVNDAWLEALGYEREEVIGRSSTDLGLFPDRAQQQQLADGLREHGLSATSNCESKPRPAPSGMACSPARICTARERITCSR